MTDTTTEAQLARIAAIKAHRSSDPKAAAAAAVSDGFATPKDPAAANAAAQPRSKKRSKKNGHAALGGRVAVAGIGASGLLGIVTVIGAANPAEQAGSAAPEIETAQSQSPLAELAPNVDSTQQPSTDPLPGVWRFADGMGVDVESVPTPIYLTANPIVRTITVQPPPIFVTIVDPAPVLQSAGAPAVPAPQPPVVLRTQASPAPGLAAAPAPVAVAPAPAQVVVAPAPAPAAPAVVAPAPAPPAPAPPAPAPQPAKSKGSG